MYNLTMDTKKNHAFSSEGLHAAICQSIRQRRKEKNWSQEDLAKKLGMMQRHISEIERGKVMPRLDTVLNILRILNVDLVLVPQKLVRLVQVIVDDNTHPHKKSPKDRPFYAAEEDDEES